MGTHARVSAWIIVIEAWRVNEVRVGVDIYNSSIYPQLNGPPVLV
jgi:hypothetical protein